MVARDVDALPPVPSERLRRLTVAQYDAMAVAGILGPEDRVELLEGWLVEKMTKNPRHRIATRATRVALEQLVASGWYVDSQEPIVTDDSEPEPDVAVIRGSSADYLRANPPARAVGLVVEIADTSLVRDRELKGRIYARARIPAYWVLDVTARRLEVYTEPRGEGAAAAYGARADAADGDTVAVVLDGVEVGRLAVAMLLG